ncbi:MAG: cytochrome c [Nitrospinaceae bacterium]
MLKESDRSKLYALSPILMSLLLASCTPQPTQEVPDEFKVGQKYFHRVCSDCHGSDAMGGHTKAPRLIDVEYLPDNFSDDEIRDTILEGADKMPPQKNKVTREEVTEIIKYLRHSQQAVDLVVEEDSDEEIEEEDIQEG